MKTTRYTIVTIFILVTIFSLCIFIYLPGLSGAFLFDDFANLPTLGHYGPIDNIEAFKLYISSGIAGPTGRPLSLLSFLIDAQNWPADPWPFKRTSLVLHIINGFVLFLLCLKTLQVLNYKQRQSYQIALLACSMWLLHPLFVSTVLYPVQRMTQLSALFAMLGLLYYILLRIRFLQQPANKYLFLLSLGIPIFIVLATFSKENGALLPLLILIYEVIIFKHTRNNHLKHKTFFYWYFIFIILPSLFIITYFANHALTKALVNYSRDFSLYERLLTEGRILIHYLYQLFIPHSATNGIYNDELIKSTSLFSPITTLLSLFSITLLLFLALKFRKKYPLFSLSIIFFFVAHIMESGVIMLELYFEHRNYLPAIFLFLPLAAMLLTSTTLKPQGKIVIIVIITLTLSGLTWLRTTLWGSPVQQTVIWSASNPTSPRTQTYLALELQKNNHYPEAEKILMQALLSNPDDLMLTANLFGNRCSQNKLTQEDISMLSESMLMAKRPGSVIYKVIDKLIKTQCSNLKLTQIEEIIKTILSKKTLSSNMKESLFNLYGHLKIKQGLPNDAVFYYKKSLKISPSYNKILSLASTMASKKHYVQALSLIDYFSMLPLKKPHKFREKVHSALSNDYFKKELKRMQLLLKEDIADSVNQ